MISNVQYIVDNLGNKVSVIVPYMDWEKMQKLINKMEILQGIKEGMLEIKKSAKKGRKMQTLTEFLDECRG
jgi:hypothetical protein